MGHRLIIVFFVCAFFTGRSLGRRRNDNNLDDWDELAEYIKCGQTSDEEVVVLTNPEYPEGYRNGIVCNYYIRTYHHRVVQLRIEFIQLSLAPPTGDGYCTRDYISIESDSLNVPRLCGENSGQHVYVHLQKHRTFFFKRKHKHEKHLPINIKIAASSSFNFTRRWKIRVIQIKHHRKRLRKIDHFESIWRAPSNCLQYFVEPSGNVQSFNYKSGDSASFNSLGVVGSQQIANLNYTICIRQHHFNCAIVWQRPTSDSYAFTLNGDVTSVDQAILGTGVLQETTCTTDYIIIPSPRQRINNAWTLLPGNRTCGLGFVPTASFVKPFTLQVTTDANETPDIANRGFFLTYSQQATCN